jgi:transcriptional regulator with XRE-family HTH domain
MQDTLARRLRVFRAERGLTLREAEELTGVDKDTLSKIERGLRHPYDVTLSKIARGYGVPVEDLLEEPAPLAEAPQESGRSESGPVSHLRPVHDSVTVSEAVKQRIKDHLDAAIHDLELSGLSEQAAVIERVREEVGAA